jgi:hypothetical protein
MNVQWHRANKMPQRATQAQRLAWHLEHQRQCACRPIPRSLQALAAKQAGKATGRRKCTVGRLS